MRHQKDIAASISNLLKDVQRIKDSGFHIVMDQKIFNLDV